jgi:quercetin dioxygenase-like cupin family protein
MYIKRTSSPRLTSENTSSSQVNFRKYSNNKIAMLMITSLTLLLTSAVSCAPFSVNPTANGPDMTALILSVRNAITGADRENILSAGGPKAFVFDFANPPSNTLLTFPGGMSVQANEKTFPALSGVGMAVTTTILNPCAIRQPHTHARGAEFNVIMEGSITTQYKAEEGNNFVTNELSTYSSTFFPKGSIHGASNPSCNRAVLMTIFDSNDPGLTNSAPNFFGFNDDIVEGVVGGDKVLSAQELAAIRADVGSTSTGYDQACLTQCGIKMN